LTDRELRAIFEKHADTVYRVCFTYFKGHVMDAEDAVQTVFLNLIKCGKTFESAGHEKAWLIVCASNTCKNMLKRKSRKVLEIDQLPSEEAVDETFEMVLALPEVYKLTIYLFYYEGYSAKEIGGMLGKRQSTIWKYLKVGRDMLRERISEEMP
jgi:RNA polymerase sigma-70 factor (ECF subfamily)